MKPNKILNNDAKNFLKETGFFVLDILYNAVIIIVLVVLIRTYLISPFRVVGSSMADTLSSNEFILINKLSYRIGEPERFDPVVFRPPITGKYPHKFEELVIANEAGDASLDLSGLETTKPALYCKNSLLQRFFFCKNRVSENDLAYVRVIDGPKARQTSWRDAEKHVISAEDVKSNSFDFEADPETSYLIRIYDAAGPEFFVKRIIGVPGDTVKIENGRVYVKGPQEAEFTEASEPYLNQENANNTYFSQTPPIDEFVVPEGHYYVLGDNRNHSNDSRSWYSPIDQSITPYVSEDQLSGKVLMVLWPLMDIRLID